MLINNIELSSLGIKLYDRVIYSNAVKTVEDWLEGDIQPTWIRQQDSFKKVKLSFLVLGNDEDDAFLRISKLTNMLKSCEIKFDDLNYIFSMKMTGQAEPTRLKNGNFIVNYQFTSDYAKGEREIYTTDANLTNAFRLQVVYYQNSTQILATEGITIRASSFEETGNTFASIGIDMDKYRPDYYNQGIATNLGNRELTYENLQNLGTLIINYPPISYNLTVEYFMGNNDGNNYEELLSETINFTYPQLNSIQTIGQLINVRTYKPEGYRSNISFTGELTVENLLSASPIYVFYDKIQNEQNKNITVVYEEENDVGEYILIDTAVLNFRESDFSDGLTLQDIININARRPNQVYFNEGYIVDKANTQLITYQDLEVSYTVRYARATNSIFIEYYYGTYPNWYRVSTITLPTKYKDSYQESFDISDLGINLNRFHTGEYQQGRLYNANIYTDYDSVITSGVLQVYYIPIDFTIQVGFVVPGEETVFQDITINALDFLNNPVLTDIIPVLANKPEGYQFDPEASYQGEVSLSALTQASPISIVYTEIEAPQIKNIIVKYKQQLSSTYATINTSIITLNEADTIGGIRLKDVFNLNLYKPEYYENGVLDGYSFNELLEFDEVQANYTVLYNATTYTTPVRYYTDDVDDLNWIGSSSIAYRVIDFTVDTTLYDLGFNVNLYKPSYSDDGDLQYNGPVNFLALRELPSIDVIYETIKEPDDEEFDYPHRFLFLEHNDLGDYENLHPNWTMNHAYINTGVAVEDMSKLTVIMECARVDENVPLHNVNQGYGYLFGSSSVLGSYYMRFNNQTQYGTNLTGVNTYEAQSGLYSDALVLTEERAIGWGENSGIYSIERPGYSTAVFTYTNTMQSEQAQMPYPLYLFANNNAGRYEGGLAGIGIYGCRIYYGGTLLRDFIPVQYYDIIKGQVAPSNCLYDKVSETFFEDATGQNSFNIIDDERYTDTNLDHKIGHCYVQYYKGNTYMQTLTFYFRASDFVNKTVNPYEKFLVDTYQPAYYKSGVIQDFNNKVWDFDNMNNAVYTVIYEEQANTITVNYWTQDGEEVRTLLATETIAVNEKDFLQVPTFGDIVRLNKYKPDGYETNFVFPSDRITLKRVVENSPYDIVYTQAEDLTTYQTVITYIKKVYGIRTYETVGTQVLTFDQTNFRDGEYIDFYIDKNLMKPEKYYKDGIFYQWFEMDERLTNPSDLKPSYTILYPTEEIYLDVNYYTDDIDEANLIASTSWGFTIDQFEPGYDVYLVDTLPNEYWNKYKPANCSGGELEHPEQSYTIEELVELGEISIVYMSLVEPHDPIDASYEQKILYWEVPGKLNDYDYFEEALHGRIFTGGKIPYIDLGYKPKEIGRLRVELKGYARPYGISSKTTDYGYQSLDYLNFFGYYAPVSANYLGQIGNNGVNSYQLAIINAGGGISSSVYTNVSPGSSGCFAFRCRIPKASGYVYTAEGPQYVDGQTFYTANAGTNAIPGDIKLKYTGIATVYRKGYYMDYDENWEPIIVNNNYGFERTDADYECVEEPISDTKWSVCWGRAVNDYTTLLSSCGNPYTIILDAYNKYGSVWRQSDSNTPLIYNFDESQDLQLFEDICQPKGTLSLFQTTNPMNGKVNIMAFNPTTFPYLGLSGSMNLSGAALGNPYSLDFSASITTTSMVITGFAENGDPIYQQKSNTRNINFADFQITVFPQMTGCAIWGIKIYDRNKLVRDLIPVAKGDIIYDYVMPDNGLFDLITEIFFGNSNEGGTYNFEGYMNNNLGQVGFVSETNTIQAQDVYPLQTILDPTIYGKTTSNYYDYDNSFIGNQYINIPCWYNPQNEDIEDILGFNDFKPDDFHLDGLLDLDNDLSFQNLSLKDIFDMGSSNIYYKLRTFTKTVVYYRDNVRVGSRDIFYSLEDIRQANTVDDLGIDEDLYYDSNYKHGRIVFDDSILADNNIQAFIDAPSPVVIYDKLTVEDNPDILYLEWYRGGASDALITLDEESPNYLDCDLTAVVLNPNGAIKYDNHYHTALYEDEVFDYFIPYQVKVNNKFTGIHRGPARRYQTLAMIVERDTYTITEERNGWGRLKEYPIGWILLNQTEEIVGPGQNPAYDAPSDTVATIPFKQRVEITKMTVDRLWCYIPAQESWVKAEDLSFDQAGRLYNGISIEVIDLTQVDWANASSLSDVGVFPEKYLLRFHQPSGYTYDGAYTQEAFSQLHSLDFVYPETIYNYSCLYYKDNKKESNLLGRASFSCSISDWNPDWDIFIETSWQYDENDQPINPTLYRDTELVLTWDYFGFDRNLFKPEGYYDGIYLWNSRTWDKDNRKFTFNELIRCGTQYVVYPIFDVNAYKLYIEGNEIYRYTTSGGYVANLYVNPGVPMTLSNGEDKYFENGVSSSKKIYDIYLAGEIDSNLLNENGMMFKNWLASIYTVNSKFSTAFFDGTYTPSDGYKSKRLPGWQRTFFSTNPLFPIEDTDCFVFNVSNLRETPTTVIGRGNYYTDRPFDYYIADTTPANKALNIKDRLMSWEYLEFIKINDETNLQGHNRLSTTENANLSMDMSLVSGNNRSLDLYNDVQKRFNYGILYETISYDKNMMIHYYVPVPKGLWYNYDGQENLRIPENGLFDLLTGEVATCFKASDDGGSNISVHLGSQSQSLSSDRFKDGKSYLFRRNQRVNTENAYDYFQGWEIETTPIYRLYSTQVDGLKTYRYPDIYSGEVNTLLTGTTIPVSEMSVSGEHLVGTWYRLGNEWISTQDTVALDETQGIVREKRTLCLVPKKTDMTKFYIYRDVRTIEPWRDQDYPYNDTAMDLGNQGQVITVDIFKTVNGEPQYFWVGNGWLPKEYTHLYTQEENINYVVSVDIPYYKYPIEDENYREGTYLYGERITALYSCINNPDWLYTGIGWIRKNNNISIIE